MELNNKKKPPLKFNVIQKSKLDVLRMPKMSKFQ